MSGMEIAGEVVQPTPIGRASALPAREDGGMIKPSGNYPFTAVFHHEWEYVPEGEHIAKGGEWLPKICEARHVPGANGTRLVGKNGSNATNMLAGLSNKRSIVIPLFEKRLGEYASYLKKYPVISKHGVRAFYCYAWVKAVLIHNGRDVTFKQDMAKAYGFRRKIVTSGIIDGMPSQALESEIALIRNRMSRWDDLMSGGKMDRDAYEQKVKEALARIAAMETAFRNQFGSGETLAGAVVLDPEGVTDAELFAEEDAPLTDDDAEGIELEPAAAEMPKRSRGKAA